MAMALHSTSASAFQPPRFAGVTKSAANARAFGALLEPMGTVVLHARGKTVVEEGDPVDHVFKVVAGALRSVRLLADGRRQITSFLLPGDFVGFSLDGQHAESIEVVADVTLVRYARGKVEGLLESNPRMNRHLLDMICGELAAAQDQLMVLGRKNALERLATFLLAMADRFSERSARGVEVELPMNRQDVADYLGLTIETVSRLISHLRSRRIIDVPNAHRITLLDEDALEEISSCGA